jgi:hypothetical protein
MTWRRNLPQIALRQSGPRFFCEAPVSMPFYKAMWKSRGGTAAANDGQKGFLREDSRSFAVLMQLCPQELNRGGRGEKLVKRRFPALRPLRSRVSGSERAVTSVVCCRIQRPGRTADRMAFPGLLCALDGDLLFHPVIARQWLTFNSP